jgi:methyl-accepting chemotaxis protein
MSTWKNLKIGTKIYAAFGAILVILATLGAFAIYELAQVNKASTELADNWMPSIKAVSTLNTATSDFRVAEEMHVLQTTDDGMAKAEQDMNAQLALIAETRKAYEPMISSDEEQATYNDFAALWTQYLEIHQQVYDHSRKNETEAARDLINGKSREVYDAASSKLMRLIEINQAGGEAASADGDALYAFSRSLVIGLSLAAVALAALLAYAIVRSVSKPIIAMTSAMGSLAEGKFETEVPAQDQKDEVGAMAAAVQVFKVNMIRNKEMQEREAAELEARAKRAQAIASLTEAFEKQSTAVVKTVSSAATEMQATASSMSATAEETARQATTVAAASEQASTNVQTVASATEELTASISEITTQVSESTRIVGVAVAQASETNEKVKGLSEAAQKIGDVVRLINDIAGQTNLLALNATIEAARAGEAGKGFAVVASEVKTLATQTAKATEEISGQIRAIQDATASSAESIENISKTIGRVSEISTAIASAVEEQGAATQEIARNVQQAAIGTQEVSTNIVSVTEAAQHTGTAATQLLGASGDLAKQAEVLKMEVERYIEGVKAA